MNELPGPLVTVDWLAAHVDDPRLRLVHVGPDRTVYDESHLRGAVFADLYRDLGRRGFAPETGSVEREWLVPAADDVARLLAGWGAGEDDRIVFYDDVGENRHAARAYWLCRVYAVARRRLHLLDGGLPAWLRAGLPATRDVPDPAPPARPFALSAEADPGVIASAADVLTWSAEAVGVGSSGAAGPDRLLDVRTIDEFLGRDVQAARGGRIPGSRHRVYSDFVAPDGHLRPVADALAIVRASGVEPAELRAVYCQGGVRAAIVWFVLHELAGYDVRNYACSWEEWGNRPDLPVEV